VLPLQPVGVVEATWIEERPIALPVAGEDLLAAALHRLDKLHETGPELAQARISCVAGAMGGALPKGCMGR